MNVEERKQQARNSEQRGEFAEALGIYQGILADLEGTQEIWRELPLYVKAGDLSLKMNDSSGAISQYEKAARAYAAYGSSKSVIALCTKILRVNAGHTHAFLRLVRLMIERDHLAEARLVLVEYADRMKLPKAGSVLEDSAGRPDEELKPLLELLLELGGRYEYARAQGRGELDAADVGEVQGESQKTTRPGDSAKASDLNEEEVKSGSSAGLFEQGYGQNVGDDDAGERAGELAAGEEFESEAESEVEEEPVTGLQPEGQAESPPIDEGTTRPGVVIPEAEEVQWVDDRPSQQMSTPRASRKVLFREGEYRKNKPNALWIGLGVVAVVVVGGLSLLLFGVIPLGGDGSNEELPPSIPVEDPSDSALLAGAEPGDSTDVEGLATVEDTLITGVDNAQVVEDSAQVEATTGDAALASQPEVFDELPAVPTEPATPPSSGVRVQDFGIESSTEFTADGRVGFRITQILGTGEQLTLSAVYYGEDIDSAPGTSEITLAPLVGDTTTAMMHFNGYAVEARAIVSASVLQTLLGRLVEVPTPE